LGLLALIGHNFDLPSIAGIIAAIGTGIDDQLIILDESEDKYESMARRIKKALFILVTAFATTFLAMIPLTGFLSFMGIGATSGGLLKGFAITTLIGITIGILFTRPAFADIIKQFEDKR
jgi:preprotein translocase subunit SecD